MMVSRSIAAALVMLGASATAAAALPPNPPIGGGGGIGLAILRPCATANLRASVGSDTGATLHRELRIVLTNVGARACAIDGYPAVRLLDAARGVHITAESFSGSPRLFTIGSGGQAAFGLRIATGDGTTTYMTSPTLAIIPPGDITPLLVKIELPIAPTIAVTALEPAAK